MSVTNEVPQGGVDEQTGRWVLVATILAASMAFIMGSALNVALPAIQESLGATGSQLLWIRNAYVLLLASLILIGGSLGDHFGRKRIYMIGIVIFTVASVICGLSPTANFLIGARVLQGLGGALMIPGSLASISASFPPSRRGRAIGTWSALTTIVTVAGPLLGGGLTQIGLWRGVFLINVPLALISLYALITRVPESYDESAPDQLDYAGAAFTVAGLGGLVFAFIVAPTREAGFADPSVIAALVIGVVGMALFIWQEARIDHPMMPLSLFKSPTFAGTNLLTFFLYGALGMFSFVLSLNLIQIQGYGEFAAGLSFAPFSIMLFLLSRWAGGLVDRIGPRVPLIVGPLIAGGGFILTGLVGLTEGPAQFWTTFLPGLLVFGIGMGITVAPLTTSVLGSVPTHNAGTASGVNNAISRATDVLTTAVLGAVLLLGFTAALRTEISGLDLSQEAQQTLIANSADLGATQIPESVAAELTGDVELAIKQAFVDVFRTTLFLCAGLAFVSAAMAAWLVEPQLHDMDAQDAETTPEEQQV
ncbi:MAG: MFS transporter [Anaerolineae bacterium]